MNGFEHVAGLQQAGLFRVGIWECSKKVEEWVGSGSQAFHPRWVMILGSKEMWTGWEQLDWPFEMYWSESQVGDSLFTILRT